MSDTKKLLQKDLHFFLSQHYEAPVEHWICICFLLPPEAVNWEEIKPKNKFPYRQLVTVHEALNDPNSGLIACKEENGVVRVKRDTFMKWAKVQWSQYDEVKQALKAFKKYKRSKDKATLKPANVRDKFSAHMRSFFGSIGEERPAILEKSDAEIRAAFRDYLVHEMVINPHTLRRYVVEYFLPELKKIRERFKDSVDE